MTPKKIANEQGYLFLPRLSLALPQDHPLLRLGKTIDWQSLEKEFSNLFPAKTGRPPAPVRLMVGLLMLRHMHGLSDENVVKFWGQNHFWQAFCGYDTLAGHCPVHPTALVRCRQRLGQEGMNRILQQTLTAAKHLGIHHRYAKSSRFSHRFRFSQ